MTDNWLNVERWKWNWTELCGHRGDINPVNPETDDLSICFQQLCLQVKYNRIQSCIVKNNKLILFIYEIYFLIYFLISRYQY